ncbi:tRNA (adenosine(37)-N6)-threonylcarbamoyltransferase complex transferase subunit TsaD [Candidatus Kaiserbacteria bacterium]|nr:tRNA (adenosine(37)-N6)-threonylcarbamoyltransferase complex transferase subunit TsaD [Candidatus Kaiserbacteria bacterium]USN88484.1 MAG: tRNA (adenosine(37)-N6)-threonylcarbamoyltransferase complex transferase subunit TsaD [Candidatus Nomurabacteria bacterium]
MLILSIETSCDETAVSLVQATGTFPHATYEVLGNGLWSQIDIHREYGGVFPALAKREHAATIVAMLEKAWTESGLEKPDFTPHIEQETEAAVREILNREHGLADQLLTFHQEHGALPVDLIAVTSGPGLEPALWVGVNFARALALLWDAPVVPTNHMEGHILASIFDADRDNQLSDISFPAISLLISGGHTELILMRDWGTYEKIGQTRDDAVGEAFDKVARLMGIPYPGGPEISKRAAEARKRKLPTFTELPTPMLHSGDLDFSFSGLKTAVRYAVQNNINSSKQDTLSDDEIAAVARDFEDAVTTVLVKKTIDAIETHGATTLIVGGGVSANRHIKQVMEAKLLTEHPEVTAYFPPPGLSTDNSIMIALAGHARKDGALAPAGTSVMRADGNKSLA